MREGNLGLGPTETEIMDCLWLHGPLTVRQIHTKITAYRLIAYTTLLTTSARMEEKGLITRHTTSDGYNSALLLTPTVTRTELITHAVQEFRADVISHQYPSDKESYHLPRETQAALETVLERKRAMRR